MKKTYNIGDKVRVINQEDELYNQEATVIDEYNHGANYLLSFLTRTKWMPVGTFELVTKETNLVRDISPLIRLYKLKFIDYICQTEEVIKPELETLRKALLSVISQDFLHEIEENIFLDQKNRLEQVLSKMDDKWQRCSLPF